MTSFKRYIPFAAVAVLLVIVLVYMYWGDDDYRAVPLGSESVNSPVENAGAEPQGESFLNRIFDIDVSRVDTSLDAGDGLDDTSLPDLELPEEPAFDEPEI